MTVDQHPRGLLVPAWRGKTHRSVLVVADLPEAGDLVGRTPGEVATRFGLSEQAARKQLLAGEMPAGKLRPGRKLDPRVREWLDLHFGPEISASEAAKKLRVIPKTIRLMALQGRRPDERAKVGRKPKKPAKVLGDKVQRRSRRAAFVVQWAKKHAPAELHDAPIRVMAAHFQVTEMCVRGWASRDLPPKTGGYRRGELAALSGKPKAKPKKKKARKVVVEQAPLRPVNKQRLLAAFMAELHERAPPRNRLNRIFLAEIPA